jgi:hypothetical protein
MIVETLIKASWFYTCENEKNKMNWLLYEYACKLYEHIDECQNKTIAKWRAQRSNERIAEFCAYFAKRMRQNIHSRDADVSPDDAITADEFIRDYWHANTRRETEALADVGEAAWLELLKSCSACPTGCLNAMSERCDIFDRMEQGGYLS